MAWVGDPLGTVLCLDLEDLGRPVAVDAGDPALSLVATSSSGCRVAWSACGAYGLRPSTAFGALHSPHLQSSSCSNVSTLTARTRRMRGSGIQIPELR